MTNENQKPFFESQMFWAAFVLIGVLLTFWLTVNTRLSALEIRVNSAEKTEERIFFKLDKIDEKIDNLQTK